MVKGLPDIAQVLKQLFDIVNEEMVSHRKPQRANRAVFKKKGNLARSQIPYAKITHSVDLGRFPQASVDFGPK
jgi:hypothetical protein